LSSDQIRAFTFDDAPIRGRVVRLTDAWQTIRSRHQHDEAAEQLLGEMVAIVAMLAQGIKLDGSVMLQIRGNGSVRTAMAECVDRTMLRGILRTGDASATDRARVGGAGQLAITLKPHRGQMYQGIVLLEADSVSRAVETYFDTSEQLPTRIWATATPQSAVGLMLQRMPDPPRARPPKIEQIAETWRRIQMLADTVTDRELLTLPADRLLVRLFNEEAVRLRQPQDLEFGCTCSRERTANTLRILGRAEVDDILAQEGRIEVTCEFCGANYRYDPIDARLLFEPFAMGLPNSRQ
jgi:molecular chaperone Hsp33